jgi:hypothetical protein
MSGKPNKASLIEFINAERLAAATVPILETICSILRKSTNAKTNPKPRPTPKPTAKSNPIPIPQPRVSFQDVPPSRE